MKTMAKYSSLQIAERAHAYLKRARNNTDGIKAYPFDEIATFQIIGGSQDESGTRKEVTPLYHGRFLDIVVLAVQHKDFQANWCSAEDTGNIHSGYVVKWTQPEANAPPARPKGLERLMKAIAAKEESKKKRK